MRAPCCGCSKRKLHCHSTCDTYMEFKIYKQAESDFRNSSVTLMPTRGNIGRTLNKYGR